MSEFESAAELSLSVPNSELSAVRSDIEDALSDLPLVGGADLAVDGTTQGQLAGILDANRQQLEVLGEVAGGDEESARATRRARQQHRWARQTRSDWGDALELLESIDDNLDDGGGGGGLFGGLGVGAGAGLGGGIGMSALGVGAGVGLAGLGIGAGFGAATGNFAQDEFVVGDVDITLAEEDFVLDPTFEPTFEFEPAFDPTFDPEFEFSPVFTPEMFNIDTRVDIGPNAFRFDPTFGPEKFDFSPTIGRNALQLGPEQFDLSPKFDIGDITIDPEIAFNPTLNMSPTLNITGIDMGGFADEVVDEVVNSRRFTNELRSTVRSEIEDFKQELVDDFNPRR